MSGFSALRDRVIEWHRLGRFAEADDGYRRLLEAAPEDDTLRHDHAVLLMQHGRNEAAAAQLEKLVLRPSPVGQSEFLLAMIHHYDGRISDALHLLERSLRRRPDDPWALALSGALHTRRGDPYAGEAALRRALELQPDMVDACHDLGIALHRQRRWREAIDAYRHVLRQGQDDPLLRQNLARCLESQGAIVDAVLEYRALVERWPARLDLWLSLACLQAQCCDFDGEARSVDAIEALTSARTAPATGEALEAFPLTFLPLSPKAHRSLLAWCDAQVLAAVRDAPATPAAPEGRARSRDRLRLGYLSPDLGQHAVGSLIRDLFAAHDRSRFEVHGYSLRRHEDPTAEAIRAGCDVFREIGGLATRDMADLIARDGIDVLIDLGGYTEGARPELLALRPAPLQLGYLGFIHDYGEGWLDGLLIDATVDTGAANADGIRRLHLAGCMLPAPRRTAVHAEARRSEFGLPDGTLFASFNNSYKLDRELIDAWIEIARAVPAANFVVYVPEHARAALGSAWIARGGSAGALHLVPKLAVEAHARRSALCDLHLDAFRYQGGATSIAALDAGLPILSREGASPLARLGVSLNRFLGLDELVCSDTATYIERACELARAPSRLSALRAKMMLAIESRRLFDPRRVAEAIEAIVIAERARKGRAPAD